MAHLGHICCVCTLSLSLLACGASKRSDTAGGTPTAPADPVAKTIASADSATLAEFTRRLDSYITTQRQLAKKSPDLKETKQPSDINVAEEALAAKIRAARKNARQGDIFTPQVAALFRRLMNPEVKGPDGRETKANINDEPASVPLRVNAKYPLTKQPLPTVPPNILATLPQLPADVEYRIVGRDLILRDVDANIIVDFIPNAIRS